MTMKAIRYILLLCLIVAISCTKEQKIEKKYPAFIYSYYHIYGTFNNEDTSKIAQNVYLEGSPSVRAIRLNLMGQCYVTADDYLSGTTTQSEQFLDLCNKFGDWCPNGYTYKYDPRYDLFEDISHDVCKDVIYIHFFDDCNHEFWIFNSNDAIFYVSILIFIVFLYS